MASSSVVVLYPSIVLRLRSYDDMLFSTKTFACVRSASPKSGFETPANAFSSMSAAMFTASPGCGEGHCQTACRTGKTKRQGARIQRRQSGRSAKPGLPAVRASRVPRLNSVRRTACRPQSPLLCFKHPPRPRPITPPFTLTSHHVSRLPNTRLRSPPPS